MGRGRKKETVSVAVHGGANRAVPAPVSVPTDAGVPFLDKAAAGECLAPARRTFSHFELTASISLSISFL